VERNNDDDMLHPDTREILTRINAENERKIMQHVYAAEDPAARDPVLSGSTKLLLTLLFLGAAGFGGYTLWKHYGPPAEGTAATQIVAIPSDTGAAPPISGLPDDLSEPAVAPPVAPSQEPLPNAIRASENSNDPANLRAKLDAVQAQLKDAIGKRDNLESQLTDTVNSDKKVATKRAGLISLVERAYDELVQADQVLASSRQTEAALKEEHSKATNHHKLVLNTRITRASIAVGRAEANAEKAADYMCEKLTALHALSDKKRWRREELGSRRELEIKIQRLKEEAKAAKTALSPQAESLAKLLIEQERAIDALQARENETQKLIDEITPAEK